MQLAPLLIFFLHHKTQPFIFTLAFPAFIASMGSLGGESDGKTKHLPLSNLFFNFVASVAVEVEELVL